MRATEELRFNFFPHAVLLNPTGQPGPHPITIRVWLNCADGNTSGNPKFKEIRPKRGFMIAKDAIDYGERLCRGATSLTEND